MLVALRDGQRVEAATVARGPAFACPACGGEVVLKKGRIVVHHFAHKPPVTCAWGLGETLAHIAAKSALCDALRRRGLDAELECPLPSSLGDRRADVLLTSPGGRPVAFELQHQPLDLGEIEARTAAYAAAEVPVVWIAFLGARIRGAAEADGEAGMVVRRYPARPWEKWAHGHGGAALWYWDAGRGALWRGRMFPGEVYVPPKEWFAEGEERYAGGFWRPAKRWVELKLEGPIAASDVRIKLGRRQAAVDGVYRFPAGATARLVLPDNL